MTDSTDSAGRPDGPAEQRPTPPEQPQQTPSEQPPMYGEHYPPQSQPQAQPPQQSQSQTQQFPWQAQGDEQTQQFPWQPYATPYQPAAGYPQPEPAPPAASDAPRKTRPTRTILVAAITAALVGGGVGAGTVALLDNRDTQTTTALSSSTQTAPATAKVDGTVSAAAAKIQPSVVTINVRGSQESGTGSGVIIRSEGYILTNNHVVSVGANGGSITVLTDDGQQATAKVVGVDPADDLAVVKVDGLKNLTAATFASSASLVVGQTVVAVGAPLGLSDTVTSGIVSTTSRPVRSGDNDQAVFNAVQTDAAINPGNSGGPLVDLNGNVVGINAAIASANSGGLQVPGQTQQSGNIGIGFAIPSDEASRIATELINTGKATHAIIGVKVAQPTTGTASTVVGATLSTVEAGSPAAAAGLKAGDVVTMVDKQRIQDADGLIAAIRSHSPGETVTLSYTRGGTPATASVTLKGSTS